jgi:tetratricopeptide (TPR) repeat protein
VVAIGCATTAPPVTKIVNGRIVVTRSVSPEAYEHVSRAELYEEEERWQEAAEELQRALPFDPDAAEVRAHLAELFVRLGRLDDAAEEIARSLQIAPTVDGYLAEAHLAEAQPTEAKRARAVPALRQAAALALDGDDAEAIERAHLELADAQIVALDLAGALETVRQLERTDPVTLRGRVQLAALAWPLGALDEAKVALTDALKIEPNDVEARILLGELQIATNQISAGKASFREAIDRSDGPIAVAEAYAGWLILRGDETEAQELAERLSTDAGSADALAAVSALETTVKRPDRALALAERAQKLGAGAGVTALLTGAALAAKDDKDGAVAKYLGVARSDSAFFDSRLRAAEVLREQGKLDEAERALGAAAADVTTDEKAVLLAINWSRVDEKRGDAARAARRLDDALNDSKRGKDPKLDSRLILARAAVDDRRGDWQKALARAEELLAREPRNVEALNFAGFIGADHDRDLPRATKRLQAAVALSPGSGGVVDSLGWVYLHAGDLVRAELYLEQAGRLEPSDPEILGHLGDLYARRKERDRALATWRKALALKPTDRVARELGDRIRALEATRAAGR